MSNQVVDHDTPIGFSEVSLFMRQENPMADAPNKLDPSFDPRDYGAEPDVTWGAWGIDSIEPEGI